MSKVAFVNGKNGLNEATLKAVKFLGGLCFKSGSKVIIKPNICNAKNPQGMVITDFEVIEAITHLVKKAGGDPMIVESDNIADNANNRIIESGLMNKLEEWDVPFLNLSLDDCVPHEVAGNTIEIPRSVLEADYLINIAKIKTCAHTLVTLGIKNLYGCLKEAKKSRFHKKLDEILPFLARTIRCDLTLIDGGMCMEGNGPTVGNPRNMGVIVAGRDIVSVDAFCANLMGFKATDISHIAGAAKLGVGQIKGYEVIGDDWQGFVCRFEKPYSLRATVKSISTIRDIYLKR